MEFHSLVARYREIKKKKGEKGEGFDQCLLWGHRIASHRCEFHLSSLLFLSEEGDEGEVKDKG